MFNQSDYEREKATDLRKEMEAKIEAEDGTNAPTPEDTLREILDRDPSGVIPGAPHYEAIRDDRMIEISQPNRYRKGPKRTIAEIQRDNTDIADLYLRGYSHRQIAEHISANRPYTLKRVMVTHTIHAMYARWQEYYLTEFNKVKLRELARIDRLEAAYWDAWEESKKPKLEVEQVNTDDEVLPKFSKAAKQAENAGSPTVKISGKKTTTRKAQRDPNFMYLTGIQWCINKRCEIFGLNAPREANVNFNWKQEAEKAGIENVEEAIDGIANEFLALARGAPSGRLESGAEET